MDDWIIRLIEQGGYWGIALLMVIENIFPPIPSEVIMGVGGMAVARGTMAFWPLLAVGTAGSTLGNYAWFLLGRRLGYERLQPLVDRWGRWLTLEWEDVERASTFFQRHGQWVVLVLRMSPFLRTMISLPAGLARMKHWKFLAFTFVGSGVWNVALISGGHWLADSMESSQHWLGWGIAIIAGLAIAGYIWRVMTWKRRGN